MNTNQVMTALGGMIVRQEEKPRRLYIDIQAADIVKAATVLFSGLDCRFMTVTGTDTLEGAIELLYHFADDSSGTIISLRVLLNDREHPSIETLSPLIKGALWIEREIHELLGVDFKGHPDLKHLLLGEDWPEGNYPLRHNDHDR